MLFLQPATSTEQFVTGLSTAAAATKGARYIPLTSGNPTHGPCGCLLPRQRLGGVSERRPIPGQPGEPVSPATAELAALRRDHLGVVADLVEAIRRNRVDHLLGRRLDCH